MVLDIVRRRGTLMLQPVRHKYAEEYKGEPDVCVDIDDENVL